MTANVGDSIESIVWGNKDYPVTQGFGTYSQDTAWMYGYAADVGWPAGTHVGLDVGLPKGTPVYAAEPGTVEQAGLAPYFRPMPVYVREQDGDLAIYGHLWTNTVQEGDTVNAGQQLGTSGEQTKPGTFDPDGTNPHLHFELRNSNGKAIDPSSELTGATGDIIPAIGGTGKTLMIVAGLGIGALIAWKVIHH